MGIASWIVGNHIDDIFEEIEESVKQNGININFEGASDLAKFAVNLKDTMDDKNQEISARLGTSLSGTFQKAVQYSVTAAGIDNSKTKLDEAIEAGDQDVIEKLTEQVDTLTEELDDIEKDILDDYRNLDGNVDFEAMHVQRNYDASGNMTGLDVKVNIENTNNGETVEMKTEIDVSDGRLNKVNIGFDI